MTAYDDRVIITLGAQAYWKLNEAAGATQYLDATANGLHLTLVNPGQVDQWQCPGIPAQGPLSAIDGKASTNLTTQYGTSTSATFQFTPGQSFTLEIWIGGVGNASVPLAVFNRGYTTLAQDARPWYILEFLVDGQVQWWMRDAAGTLYTTNSFVRCFDATYAARGPWHHVVGVYDHVATKLRLYVDGVLQAETTAPNTGWGTGAGPFALGAFNAVVSGLWMTCGAVYLRALTATEIMGTYEAGRAGATWYPSQLATDYTAMNAKLDAILRAVRSTFT